MARQVKIRDSRHQSRLVLWSFLALIAAILLPVGVAFPASSRVAEPQEIQPLDVHTLQDDQGADRGDCWQSRVHILEKNVLGLTVMNLRHEVQWCSDGQEITVLSSQSWIERGLFASWTLTGERNRGERGEGGSYRLRTYQDMNYKSSRTSSSYTYCLELDLHTDGRAEGRQC